MLNAGRPVQSLARALDLLERLAAAPRGLALCELAAQTGLKGPTVHNLLGTLTTRGYAVRLSRPVRYALGPAAQALARGAQADGWIEQAGEELLLLARRWPALRLTLALPSGGELAIRLRVAPGSRGLERPAGAALSAYASASALAWQAFGDAEAVADYRRRHPFWEHGAAVWGTPERLARALARFRRQGRVRVNLRGEDLVKLSWPVRRGGGLVGALGAAGAPGAVPPPVERALARAAAEAAARLGAGTGAGAGEQQGDRP